MMKMITAYQATLQVMKPSFKNMFFEKKLAKNSSRYVTHWLIDMDDTIVYTAYANYLAYNDAFENVMEIPMLSFNTSERFDSSLLKKYYPNLSTDILSEIKKNKDLLFPKYLDATYPNVDLIHLIQMVKKHVNVCLVTKSSGQRMQTLLKHHNLDELFDEKYHYSRETNKYVETVRTLGVSLSSVRIYENDDHEINQAIHAGVSENQITKIYI